MRILYDHQVFSLQDAGGASRYHFELVRNLQQLDEVAIEVLMGLNGSVMPFATLQRPRTRVFGHRTALKPGRARYATNEVLSAIIAPLRGRVDIYHPTLYRAIPWVPGGAWSSLTTTAYTSGFPIYSRTPLPS